MNINIRKSNILLVIIFNIVLFNSASFAIDFPVNNLPKYVVTEDEKFNKIFREGRDLIDKEDWKKATEKFKEIVCDCPENKAVDAAFYWLAFCYKKQNMFKQMDETIDRLLRNFPSSSWADDARVMKYEQLSRVASSSANSSVVGNFPVETTATTIFSTTSQTPLDREDEIKLAAFQSLLSANPNRAIEILGNMLRTEAKASETLKREVIRTLRNPRYLVAQEYGGFPVASSSTKPQTEDLSQLRATLFKGYQTESNIKVKTEIIYALGNLNDAQSHTYISQLYALEQNKELKKAIINSFGSSNYFAFASATNVSASKNSDFEQLFEIVQNEKDAELRRLAISNLRKFSGWSSKNGIIDLLSQMYDSENDEEFKLIIIRVFATAKENRAIAKLLNIAKNDKSDKMRLEAIRALRTSDNPEVLKFLEDLIN